MPIILNSVLVQEQLLCISSSNARFLYLLYTNSTCISRHKHCNTIFFFHSFSSFLCSQKQNLVNSIIHAYNIHVAQLDKLQALIQTDKIHNKNTRSMQRILSKVYLYTIWLLLYPLMPRINSERHFSDPQKLETHIFLSSCLVDRLFLLYVVMFIVQWLFHKNKLSWLFCPSSLTSKVWKICPQGKQELSTSML